MSFFYNHSSSSTSILLLLVLLPSLLLTLFFLFRHGDDFLLESLFMASGSDSPPCATSQTSTNHTTTSNPPSLHIFMGILTMPHLHERRHLLRSVYAMQTSVLTTAHVDVRFIFCKSMNEEENMFLSLEMRQYNDIIILTCSENMNEGKTFAYFSSLPSKLDNVIPRYEYVIKSDDDVYFRLDNLAKFLLDKPREDLYFGMEINMEMACVGVKEACGVNDTYMAGFGYVVSWDLVKWISEIDIARNNKYGVEDVMFGKWLNEGNKGRNRYSSTPDQVYDYKGDLPDGYFRREFGPGTVAVHKLKKNLHWVKTLMYFNVTTPL